MLVAMPISHGGRGIVPLAELAQPGLVLRPGLDRLQREHRRRKSNELHPQQGGYALCEQPESAADGLAFATEHELVEGDVHLAARLGPVTLCIRSLELAQVRSVDVQERIWEDVFTVQALHLRGHAARGGAGPLPPRHLPHDVLAQVAPKFLYVLGHQMLEEATAICLKGVAVDVFLGRASADGHGRRQVRL
eukprot:6952611-Pyramimonas_sp.AAC.1